MRIETLIQRKELQRKIECFTQVGLTQRAVALKGQLAPEAVDWGRAGERDEAISGVYLSESGEASVGGVRASNAGTYRRFKQKILVPQRKQPQSTQLVLSKPLGGVSKKNIRIKLKLYS